jgi:hypothetical protein
MTIHTPKVNDMLNWFWDGQGVLHAYGEAGKTGIIRDFAAIRLLN